MKSRVITFGESLAIMGFKDDIQNILANKTQYWDKHVMFKLRKIGDISRLEANKAIKELGLEKLGWKPIDRRTKQGKDKDKRLKENRNE